MPRVPLRLHSASEWMSIRPWFCGQNIVPWKMYGCHGHFIYLLSSSGPITAVATHASLSARCVSLAQ